MSSIGETLSLRNKELGRVLAQARGLKQMTVTAIAASIGTSRRRYTAIERGDVPITAAEIEQLAEVLGVPFSKFGESVAVPQELRRVIVQAEPGETIHLVLQVHK